jgi:hypothetical protein
MGYFLKLYIMKEMTPKIDNFNVIKNEDFFFK